VGFKTRPADAHQAAALNLLPRLTPEGLRFILRQSGAAVAADAGEPRLYDLVKAGVRRGSIDPSAIHLLYAARRIDGSRQGAAPRRGAHALPEARPERPGRSRAPGVRPPLGQRRKA
jgi:hypothetical protein